VYERLRVDCRVLFGRIHTLVLNHLGKSFSQPRYDSSAEEVINFLNKELAPLLGPNVRIVDSKDPTVDVMLDFIVRDWKGLQRLLSSYISSTYPITPYSHIKSKGSTKRRELGAVFDFVDSCTDAQRRALSLAYRVDSPSNTRHYIPKVMPREHSALEAPWLVYLLPLLLITAEVLSLEVSCIAWALGTLATLATFGRPEAMAVSAFTSVPLTYSALTRASSSGLGWAVFGWLSCILPQMLLPSNTWITRSMHFVGMALYYGVCPHILGTSWTWWKRGLHALTYVRSSPAALL